MQQSSKQTAIRPGQTTPADCVLVIDDQPNLCQLISAILSAEGAKVLSAFNERDGLQILKDEDVGILFTDLRLPGCNGIEVIRRSVAMRPQLASVVITGFGTLESAVEAIRLGACDYVTKPIDRKKVVSALNRAQNFRQSVAGAAKLIRATGLRSEDEVVAASAQMRQVVGLAERVAQTVFPVLIHGEAGVGKKLLARWIHSRSQFAAGSFVHFPCVSMSDVSPGSEPVEWRSMILDLGRYRNASVESHTKCTVYLEDVDRLPLWAQLRLLDTIGNGWFAGAGSSLRVIASTESNADALTEGTLHRGLCDLLSMAPIRIAPLRERREDIRPLVEHFVSRFPSNQSREMVSMPVQIAEDLWDVMSSYRWPGNVRELSAVVARAFLCRDHVEFERTLRQHCHHDSTAPTHETITVPLGNDLRSIECHVIREMVRRQRGNKSAAARALGMHRRTLYRILDEDRRRSKADALRQ